MTGRRRISSGTSFEATMGYCRAVVVGDRVIVAGTAPQSPDGVVDPDPAAQARRCFTIIADALAEAGSSLAEVVRTRVYLVDAADFDAVASVHGELFGDIRPVNTTVVIAGLLDPAWKLEVEVEAVIGSAAEV